MGAPELITGRTMIVKGKKEKKRTGGQNNCESRQKRKTKVHPCLPNVEVPHTTAQDVVLVSTAAGQLGKVTGRGTAITKSLLIPEVLL